MIHDTLPKRYFFRCLIEKITGKGQFRYLHVGPEDTAGDSVPACNNIRSLVYEVRTTNGWKIFRRPIK